MVNEQSSAGFAGNEKPISLVLKKLYIYFVVEKKIETLKNTLKLSIVLKLFTLSIFDKKSHSLVNSKKMLL